MGLPSENLTPTQTDGVAAFAAQLGTWAIRIQHSASFHKARTHDTYLPYLYDCLGYRSVPY